MVELNIRLMAILFGINFVIDSITCLKFITIFLNLTYGYQQRIYFLHIVVIQIIFNIIIIPALIADNWLTVGLIITLNLMLTLIKVLLSFWIFVKYYVLNTDKSSDIS